ncbi:GcrA family cell cycle regulator [Rhodoligotrophos ferricapiens]|uniref:GcrA family cell cycle regulator n=1 Tax=Rhodoligotrophos ferricapiens TaxID=3069264 RepID=UPI00315C9094
MPARNPIDDHVLRQLVAENAPYKVMVKRLRTSQDFIKRRIVELGLAKPADTARAVRNAKVRELAARGVSCSVAAEILGLSSSSLRKLARELSVTFWTGERVIRQARRIFPQAVVQPPLCAAAALLTPPVSSLPIAGGVSLLELRDYGMCRWPLGEDARGYVFCGEASEPSRPYCAQHCAIAFEPGPPPPLLGRAA